MLYPRLACTSMGPLAEFLILLALILTGGVLAGAEIAVVAMRKSRVQELADSGSKVGRLLAQLRQNPERFLSTVQVGITVLGATAAAFGGAAFAKDIEPVFRSLPLVGAYSSQIAFSAVILLVSYLSIVLGELVPKSLALRATERYACIIAAPLTALATLTRPLVWLLSSSSNLVLRLFGDSTSFTESRLSLEELRGIVDEAQRHGSLPPGASDLTLRALDLSGLTAADVMVHRRFVISLPKNATREVVRSAFIRHGHHRFPVFDGTAENVIGYISWREVLPQLWENDAPLELETLLTKPVFVPEAASAVDLLNDMRTRRIHLVVVVDEHGGISGIVTLEDIIEELIGDLIGVPLSEHALIKEPEGTFRVPGFATIREINRDLGLSLEELSSALTLGGLCITLADGRIPLTGERFTAQDGTTLEVLESSTRRVRTLRIHPTSPPIANASVR